MFCLQPALLGININDNMFYKFKPNQLQFAIHHSKTGVLENSLWVVKETAKKLDQENNKDAKISSMKKCCFRVRKKSWN